MALEFKLQVLCHAHPFENATRNAMNFFVIVAGQAGSPVG